MKRGVVQVFILLMVLSSILACKKDESNSFSKAITLSFTVDGRYNGTLNYKNVKLSPVFRFSFTDVVSSEVLHKSVTLLSSTGSELAVSSQIQEGGKTVVFTPKLPLAGLTTCVLEVNSDIQSINGGRLLNPVKISVTTKLDSADKYPRVSDEELLTEIQRRTFSYFWDFAHPVSGMARERNSSGDIVTTGGTGFGIMAILTGIHRGFISREEGLLRIQRITAFLIQKAHRFHGAFPHWLNGNTGAVQPFNSKDNGADLVETSLLIQGLLTARQFFNQSVQAEDALRKDINQVWNDVEWSWFEKDNSKTLYWHWSPSFNWENNLPIKGWNEALITYVLAASSPSFSISKDVYDNGWAGNGSLKNGNSYYGIKLPLGSSYGGPLFFSHYSFLGLNPMGLSDAYANYETQNKSHTLINYNYCKTNQKGFYGYSDECWGLTASDDVNGYLAHSPNNDNGVISPTAALSSFPYTPAESMKALKFFYYKLGDKIWKEYGFVDAFSLHEPWFSNSFLAIDQGPVIIMIENYRSGLLWNLFMSSPEIKTGLRSLGFSSANL